MNFSVAANDEYGSVCNKAIMVRFNLVALSAVCLNTVEGIQRLCFRKVSYNVIF